MKKLLLIPILLLFLGCASVGFMTPAMKSHMEVLKTQDIPFMIVAMYTSKPNPVGGVDVYVIPRITTPKTIKYISMTFSIYNTIGDEVYDSKWGGEFILNSIGFNDFTGKVTGPLSFGDKVEWKWDNAWYNSDIHCLKLRKVDVEYMDGSRKTFKGNGTVGRRKYPLKTLYAPKELRVRGGKYWSCTWSSEYQAY